MEPTHGRMVRASARRLSSNCFDLSMCQGNGLQVVGPEDGPVGVAPEVSVPSCAARACPGHRTWPASPRAAAATGNVCQPQVTVRGSFTSVGISKKLTRSVTLPPSRRISCVGRALSRLVVPALVVIGEPQEGPVGVRSARCTARSRRSTCRRRWPGWSSDRAGRRARRTSRPPWCRSAWPRPPATRFPGTACRRGPARAGRGHVEVDVHEAVELDVRTGRETAGRRPRLSPVRSASASTCRVDLGAPRPGSRFPGRPSRPPVASARQAAATPPLFTFAPCPSRRATGCGSTRRRSTAWGLSHFRSTNWDCPSPLHAPRPASTAGMTFSVMPTLLFIHSAA